LLSPAPCHTGTGRIPWNCSCELGIYSCFLFCSNMSMTERPQKGNTSGE
jgi:hypothetical protein